MSGKSNDPQVITKTITKYKYVPHKTVQLKLSSERCPGKIVTAINKKLKARIKSIPNLKLLTAIDLEPQARKKAFYPCRTEQCALNRGKSIKSHRAIYGTVLCEVKTFKRRIAATGDYQYIVKVTKKRYYTIRLKLIDVPTGKKLADLTEKTEERFLNKSITILTKELANHFQPRKVEYQETIIVPVKKDTPKTRTVKPFASFVLSNIVPVGKFKETTDYSFGAAISGGVKELFFSNSVFMITSGFYFLSIPGDDVESFYTFNLAISGGYSFQVYESLTIIPYIGFGYQFHLLDDAASNSSEFYYDPLLTFRCELNYRIHDKVYLFFTPGYTVFFEKNDTGMYINMDIGILYHFDTVQL